MFNPNDDVEVRKAGDPNDGRAGKVDHRLPAPFAWPGTQPTGARYDVAFEGGTEHGEYAAHELVKVVPPAPRKAGA